MKTLKFLLITVLLFSLTASAIAQTKSKKAKRTTVAAKYCCPMKCEGDKTYAKAGKCPVCGMEMKAVKDKPKADTTASYQCPMKCEGEKTYAKAGKCPVCNMDLTKVEATKKAMEGHEGHNHD